MPDTDAVMDNGAPLKYDGTYDGDAFIAKPSDDDPTVAKPEDNTITGNTVDDDGGYFDDLYTPGTDPYAVLITEGIDDDVISDATIYAPPKATRIIPGMPNVPLAIDYDPVMILAPDVNRKYLVLWSTGPFRWSSEKSMAMYAGDWDGSTRTLFLENHTGAIWVAPASTATSTVIQVNAASVTN
jgi:hypothetical protein